MDRTHYDKDELIKCLRSDLNDARKLIATLTHCDVQDVADWQYYRTLLLRATSENQDLRAKIAELERQLDNS